MSLAKALFEHFFANDGSADAPKTAEIMQSAVAWAKRTGFSGAEVRELEYMLSMVTARHVPYSALGTMEGLDEGSFGKIYTATYKKNDVAVKVLEATSARASSCIRDRMRELQVYFVCVCVCVWMDVWRCLKFVSERERERDSVCVYTYA
jgi:hypothetical protein